MTTGDKETAVHLAKSQAPLKVSPTLVVGLGGTGCRGLAWFNHIVREVLHGMPAFLKTMAVDTDVLEPVEQVKTPFPESDFYNLFEYLHLADILTDVDAVGPPSTRLGTLDLPSAVTERGCQGNRRLGRAVYSASFQRIIYPAVLERFTNLNSLDRSERLAQAEPARQFEVIGGPVVHVVSSLCGGTGSGMLLDIAKDIQDWSREVFGRPAEIIAHLVLPEAFRIESPQVMDKLRALACSMLEQTEFLMDHRREPLVAEYHGEKRVFGKRDQPFDACYLLNGHALWGGDTRDQLTEMIARMIHAMVLEPSAQAIQCTLNNMQLDVLSRPDRTDRRARCFSTYGLRDGTISCASSGEGLSSGRLESIPSLAEQWRFSFGFCLPALDNYAEYQAAQERFLALSNSKREDMWLDPNWLEAYLRFLKDIGGAAS